ncbi:EF-hand domain-containing protein [Stieleria sp. JC731]|uniref:EF-hand domain-containing protein n=1 Tax=Pirellulaceae TaxID=2691357 RepID=UPI001E64E435|nr:EF-hand domain-containing protein [Stieleria sp. JC731]MCC9603590.1 EF-hand domain-containing protein [Stieleria sp. JC731]
MKRYLFSIAVCMAPAFAIAQPPGGPGPRGGQRGFGGMDRQSTGSPIDKLMQYDANQDGVLTSDELSDPRLQHLFQRADQNGDGQLTREEIASVVGQQSESDPRRMQRGFGGGPPGGFNGPPPNGFGGPPPGGGPGGPDSSFAGEQRGFQPPRPGTVLPDHLISQLGLTDAQQKKLAALQELVDKRLAKILTEEQTQMLQHGPPGR